MLDEIRDHVGRYLAEETSARDLATRLPDGWDIDQSSARDARQLLLRIMGYLAEFQNGDRDEDELREELRALFPPVRTYWIEQARRTTKGGTVAHVMPQTAPVSAGRLREVAPA